MEPIKARNHKPDVDPAGPFLTGAHPEDDSAIAQIQRSGEVLKQPVIDSVATREKGGVIIALLTQSVPTSRDTYVGIQYIAHPFSLFDWCQEKTIFYPPQRS